jgi:PleD family two-component response regulator
VYSTRLRQNQAERFLDAIRTTQGRRHVAWKENCKVLHGGLLPRKRSSNQFTVRGMKIQGPASSETITLLVIDDDSQVRAFYLKCLVRAGFRVLEADNGLEALITASNHHGLIDLLITDVELPMQPFCRSRFLRVNW